MRELKSNFPICNLCLLVGAALSIAITGTEEVWAIVVFLVAAGISLILVHPLVRPGFAPLVLVPLLCCLCLLAFLPLDYFPVPEWRSALIKLGTIPLADSVNPQPWVGWFWWWLLAATCLAFAALLTTPLETRPLALVLQTAALFVAVYASLAIFSAQTGWKHAFHGGAVFGFLPNRNHTATLLVVGSVLSFGLMQWRLARGNKTAAAFAALCGAPSLAALLFFSVSRAGVVFLVFGLAVWAMGASRSPSIRKQILSAVVVLALFAGALFVFGGSTVRDRLALLWKDAFSVQMAEGKEDVDFRQPVFRDTARMISDQPLSGSGLGNFSDVFRQYRRESARSASILHPESDWLMVAAETGVFSALVLAALLVWYVVACWRSRGSSGGMLRWTATSAVIAAALHGVIDVPWHRVSLGWFLLAVAVSSAPSSGLKARAPGLSRFLFVLGGIATIAAAGWIAYEKREGRDPAPLNWVPTSAQLEKLGQERRFAQAERVARQAIDRFPLRSEAYYWLAGYLRMFQGTDSEILATVRAGRAVEPVVPVVAAEQAVILQDINPEWAMEAWVEAIERATVLDEKEQSGAYPFAAGYVSLAVAAFKDRPEWQLKLGAELESRPTLLAYWFAAAEPAAANAKLRDLQNEQGFLDTLPPALRRKVLSKWIALPDPSLAVEFMEQREAVSSEGEYWPVLARFYAEQGDLPRAVRRVASSNGISLDAPQTGDTGLRGEMAAMEAQGNPVAARRMAKEAIDAKDTDNDDLAAAIAYYASQGDWQSAWKAASRLASEAKLRQ